MIPGFAVGLTLWALAALFVAIGVEAEREWKRRNQ